MPGLQVETTTSDVDGRRLTGLDWGGDGPDVLLLHPNGFCAGIFDPIVQRWGGRFHCFAIDLPGHGGSDTPADLDSFSMTAMAADVATVLERRGGGPVRVVGHSLGGVVGTLLEQVAPERVERLVLCEPVIMPPPPLFERPPGPSPIAEGARRRRRVWASRDEMRDRYRTVPPLSGFHPEMLEAYLRHGVRDRPDGEVELCCDPAMEAAVFDCTPGPRGSWPAWDHLAAVRAPTTIVTGRDTTLPPELLELQTGRLGCERHQAAGGHLFPQEDPDGTAALLAHLLA